MFQPYILNKYRAHCIGPTLTGASAMQHTQLFLKVQRPYVEQVFGLSLFTRKGAGLTCMRKQMTRILLFYNLNDYTKNVGQ